MIPVDGVYHKDPTDQNHSPGMHSYQLALQKILWSEDLVQARHLPKYEIQKDLQCIAQTTIFWFFIISFGVTFGSLNIDAGSLASSELISGFT
jgi:hypothetical protein